MAPGTDRRSGRDTEFTEYYAARGTAMRATAYLMCGDWHLAEAPGQALRPPRSRQPA